MKRTVLCDGESNGLQPSHGRGIPVDRQLRNWSELNVTPYDTRDVHPYTRCRVIAMNGIEVKAIINSHQMARRTMDVGLEQTAAVIRRIEQQQQKVVNWRQFTVALLRAVERPGGGAAPQTYEGAARHRLTRRRPFQSTGDR